MQVTRTLRLPEKNKKSISTSMSYAVTGVLIFLDEVSRNADLIARLFFKFSMKNN